MTISANGDSVNYLQGAVPRTAEVVVSVQSNGSGGFIDPTLPSSVVGNVAALATDTGNPVKVGGKVADGATGLTAASNGQRQDMLVNYNGAVAVAAMDYGGNAGADSQNKLIGLSTRTGTGPTPIPLAVGPFNFDGTNWHRIRGDLNGQWVTPPSNYETVAASQTAQALGATGATGDYIDKLVIIPATTAPGVVTLLDNATSIPIWVGGTVGADLKPFVIDLGMKSVSGAWKVTTGANVSVIGVGRFT